MEGYGDSSYGDGFADVYDEWYHAVSDVAATVAALVDLAEGGPVLELGVGTGRIAVPLARRGVRVHGIDSSTAMLERLAVNDPDGTVLAEHGDMVDDLPAGPFAVVVVAYNTLFNLTSHERQQACFGAVARVLRPGGRFVVEAFVPPDPPRAGSQVGLRSLAADRVVLSVSQHHPDDQRAEGQFVELTEAGGVRLRPWAIRYAGPAELDAMAAAAGLTLEHRWHDFADHRFDGHSERQVAVYRSPSRG